MAITPDTKDWTWVLEHRCAQCGFDASAFGAGEVPRMIRENAAAWPALLGADAVTERPDENTWSTLEYGAHVRDVYLVFHDRLRLMLGQIDPEFANWDQDAAALAGAYNEQDPAVVARELVAAAEAIAAEFEAIEPEQWGRTGRRSNGSEFTVVTLAKYMLHDVVHHVEDVRR